MGRPAEEDTVFHHIKAAGIKGATYQELVASSGLSVKTVRRHAKRLVDDNRVTVEELRKKTQGGQRRLVYFVRGVK